MRRKLLELYGEDGLMKGGLIAHSTMVPEYQELAEEALRHGLINYDMRHGLHSDKIAHIETGKDWHENLLKVAEPAHRQLWNWRSCWKPATRKARVGLRNGKEAVITQQNEMGEAQGRKSAGKVSDL